MDKVKKMNFILFTVLIMCSLRVTVHSERRPRIAVFPFVSMSLSHPMMMSKIAIQLTKRGYDVTMFIPTSSRFKVPVQVKYTEYRYDVSIRYDYETVFESAMNDELGIIQSMKAFTNVAKLSFTGCGEFLSNAEAMKKMASMDIIVGEHLHACSFLLGENFSIPLVTVSAVGFLEPYTPFNYNPLSKTPQSLSGLASNMGWIDVGRNFFHFLAISYVRQYVLIPLFQDLKTRYAISPSVDMSFTMKKATMVLHPVDFSLEYPRSIMPQEKVIGPILVDAPSTLPFELLELMESSGQHGVIVMTFGSFFDSLPRTIAEVLAVAFSQLPQKVIWRYTGPELKLKENIKITSWMPQNDILGHPRCRLLITQCGIHSIYQAAYHGVPVLGVPFINDAMDNIVRAKSAGMGTFVSKQCLYSADCMVDAITQILGTEAYYSAARRVSKELKLANQVSSAEKAARWIDAVIHEPHIYDKPWTKMDMYPKWYSWYYVELAIMSLAVIFTIVLFVTCICFAMCTTARQIHLQRQKPKLA